MYGKKPFRSRNHHTKSVTKAPRPTRVHARVNAKQSMERHSIRLKEYTRNEGTAHSTWKTHYSSPSVAQATRSPMSILYIVLQRTLPMCMLHAEHSMEAAVLLAQSTGLIVMARTIRAQKFHK